MNAAFARGKNKNQSIYVPTRHHGLVQRACSSSNKLVVRGMKRMVLELRDRSMASGNWAILDAIFTKRLKLKEAFQAYTANQLSDLEAKLSAANLVEHLDAWIKWVRTNRKEEARTADVYWQQVVTLIDSGRPMPPNAAGVEHTSVPFMSSELTKKRVMDWLASRDKSSSGTRRKYFYALKSFVRYLVDVGVFASDPLAGLKAPKKDPARQRWVTIDVDEAIVQKASSHYQNFFAFVKGVGCDVGSAQRARVGDVNVFAATTDVRGTKTDRRRVHAAAIESWSVPYVRRQVTLRQSQDAKPDDLLFPGLTRSGISHHHVTASKRAGVTGYTLKDSRHSVGVRMRKAGRSFEEIGAQLGTSVYQAVTVYTAYDIEKRAATENQA